MITVAPGENLDTRDWTIWDLEHEKGGRKLTPKAFTTKAKAAFAAKEHPGGTLVQRVHVTSIKQGDTIATARGREHVAFASRKGGKVHLQTVDELGQNHVHHVAASGSAHRVGMNEEPVTPHANSLAAKVDAVTKDHFPGETPASPDVSHKKAYQEAKAKAKDYAQTQGFSPEQAKSEAHKAFMKSAPAGTAGVTKNWHAAALGEQAGYLEHAATHQEPSMSSPTIDHAKHATKYTAQQKRDLLKQGKAMKNAAGKPSYPINDAEDLHHAIHAVGRGGASHNKVRVHIMKNAKALNLASAIPANWADNGTLRADETPEFRSFRTIRHTPPTQAEETLEIRSTDMSERTYSWQTPVEPEPKFYAWQLAGLRDDDGDDDSSGPDAEDKAQADHKFKGTNIKKCAACGKSMKAKTHQQSWPPSWK